MSDAKQIRMEQLVALLNEASLAYYQRSEEIMSNFEYDALYDELQDLEKSTGIVLSNSPTIHVGYEVLSELPREHHESPMLSLDKTKEVSTLEEFAEEHACLVSWKMDGLTVVLTYQDGSLKKAVTRGNGEIGEVITNNARTFVNLPLTIPYQGILILRGEAVIRYSDFERLNQEIPEAEARYKNPRNLCSGSVRQLNNEITAGRCVRFCAFTLVQAEGVNFENSRKKQMEWLRSQGFETVEYRTADRTTMAETVAWYAEKIKHFDYPSDGLVICYDNIEYGRSLGRTAKFPRDSIAFKWQDETAETTLREIEWSPSRTGLINPIAIFDPVELEGTTVSRASIHNVSIARSLELGIGDHITVYKANMIIPQIEENLTRSRSLKLPSACPACGGPTEVRAMKDAETLFCPNPDCPAKQIKAFALFASRDALNIDGLSEMTLEKLIGHGYLKSIPDLFELVRYKEEMSALEGFGEKSVSNLLESLKRASHTTLPRLIYALGIPGIGVANAKAVCRYFQDDLEALRKADQAILNGMEGVGEVLAEAIYSYFHDSQKQELLDLLLTKLTIEKTEYPAAGNLPFAGMTFVITGAVTHFANRNECKAFIEELGGKTAGSVSKKTTYLINNDTTSGSAKNKRAAELGIPILSEEDLLALAGTYR